MQQSQQQPARAVEHIRNRKRLLDRTKNRQDGSRSASATASEAQFIQQSLQRTQSLLRSELQRVTHVSSAIDQDEATLQKLMMDQKSLEVKKAEKALRSLKRAQQQERNILRLSIAFFGLVVFYVMYSRVLYRFNVFAYFF